MSFLFVFRLNFRRKLKVSKFVLKKSQLKMILRKSENSQCWWNRTIHATHWVNMTWQWLLKIVPFKGEKKERRTQNRYFTRRFNVYGWLHNLVYLFTGWWNCPSQFECSSQSRIIVRIIVSIVSIVSWNWMWHEFEEGIP